MCIFHHRQSSFLLRRQVYVTAHPKYIFLRLKMSRHRPGSVGSTLHLPGVMARAIIRTHTSQDKATAHFYFPSVGRTQSLRVSKGASSHFQIAFQIRRVSLTWLYNIYHPVYMIGRQQCSLISRATRWCCWVVGCPHVPSDRDTALVSCI